MSDETPRPDRAIQQIRNVLLEYVPEYMHRLPDVQSAIDQSVGTILQGLTLYGWSRLSSEEHLARFKDIRDAAEMQGYLDGLRNTWNWGLSESNFSNIYKTAFGKGIEERRLAEQAEIERDAQVKMPVGRVMTTEEVEAEIEEQGYQDGLVDQYENDLVGTPAYGRGWRRAMMERVTKDKANASS